jgi:hypothetical protein
MSDYEGQLILVNVHSLMRKLENLRGKKKILRRQSKGSAMIAWVSMKMAFKIVAVRGVHYIFGCLIEDSKRFKKNCLRLPNHTTISYSMTSPPDSLYLISQPASHGNRSRVYKPCISKYDAPKNRFKGL